MNFCLKVGDVTKPSLASIAVTSQRSAPSAVTQKCHASSSRDAVTPFSCILSFFTTGTGKLKSRLHFSCYNLMCLYEGLYFPKHFQWHHRTIHSFSITCSDDVQLRPFSPVCSDARRPALITPTCTHLTCLISCHQHIPVACVAPSPTCRLHNNYLAITASLRLASLCHRSRNA